MDWPIAPRTCSVPNACWFRSVAFAALAFAGVVFAQADVNDCRPCTITPGGKTPAFSFTFEIKKEERSVTAIHVVNSSTHAKQRLTVTADMDPIQAGQKFFFGGVDVNFDGYLDVMLITSRGVANAYADYWIYDPVKASFEPLGNYPVLKIDAAKKRLSTYERGGSAGLEHEAKEFAFVNGKLTVMREEKQEPTNQPGVFRKVVRERAGAGMKTVKTETVRAPK